MTKKGSTLRFFNDHSKEGALARMTYLKIFIGGSFATIVLIFACFSIFWGALWKLSAHNLPGWVVDFDGGFIGQDVVQALSVQPNASKITWTVVPASQFPGGVHEVGTAVREEHTWVAIIINPGSTLRLNASLTTPNATYDGADAITVFAIEARNENAFRSLIRPSVQGLLDGISKAVAIKVAQEASSLPTLTSILTTSPKTIVAPVTYRIDNLAPFDMPVASAVTFVGLIYQLILSFFVVMIGTSAREASGFEKTLPTRSLIVLRLVSSFGAYFVISLFYCLLSVAFQLNLTRKFGHGGFVILWMLNYVNMLAVGLALESLLTLLTQKFMPFFMLTWIITNVSVCIFPIEVMPRIFHYGYAAPFYNVSRATRTIIFGTKNQVGFSFAVLIVWVIISCISLPLIQWFVRQRQRDSPQASPPQDIPVHGSSDADLNVSKESA